MSELGNLESESEQSGIHTVAPMERAIRLIATWRRLQLVSTLEPARTRAFSEEVARVLTQTMDMLVACEASGGGNGSTTAVYELLDTTYVLERLDWCVLHNVPYVDRPRRAG